MLTAVAVVPSAPVLVPELATGAATEVADLRAAVLRAAAELPDRWVVIGVADDEAVVAPTARGTFAGYGVDVPVALGPDPDGEPSELPLCALIAGWVRAEANPRAAAEVRAYAAALDPDAAVAAGRLLRAEVDATTEPVGVLVVADGANTLTPSAPGGHDPDSIEVQAALDDALAAGDAAGLAAADAHVVGRVAHQVLAGLLGERAASATELYRGAPYGVGYFVGVLRP
ncbi:hypothetical protein [Mycolicibacterium sediminis]|uniref:Uncharacterized protein n=1 Tax=Mycolicibacterium sediminis TaxID=1286180 RepID=A0A7I7QTB5_9MYCO|nr:hypothetical protein [Mycolicibacterium sediminis]BBY29465.1 hypothetical protein MSEDJ_35610 [Mycolicibacterium sediminis]